MNTEERYINYCYGNSADMIRYYVEKDGETLELHTTKELSAMVADGWKRVDKPAAPSVPAPAELVTPTDTEGMFQRHYGYEKAIVRKWEYSDTFAKWGAFVTFEDGHQCYTWPKPEVPASPSWLPLVPPVGVSGQSLEA